MSYILHAGHHYLAFIVPNSGVPHAVYINMYCCIAHYLMMLASVANMIRKYSPTVWWLI